MKNLLYFTAIFLFLSCESNNSTDDQSVSSEEEKALTSETGEEDLEEIFELEFPQKWNLTEMSTMMVNSHTTGDDMQYQEFYIFHSDKSFTKNRQQKKDSLQFGGIYSIIETEAGDKMLELTYDSRNELVENCSGNNLEFLVITSEDALRGTANACDWPSKKYLAEK